MTIPEPLRSPGRPRGGDSDCRDRLLAAAMSAFAGSGYEGASLRAIALAVGFDVSMVAHYFGSKAELWLAVVDEAAERMRAAHAEIAAKLYAPGVSAAQRLRQGVEFLFDQIASDPRLASLVLREASGEGERAVCVEERLIRPNLAFYRPLWEEAMREGVFGESDPVVAHAAMIGAIALLVSSRASIARLVGGEMDLARLREEFCRGVFGRAV
ncbi:TetR/AcrR family transcriptional regulator [Zoogloea sp.]|uniref:TetR/AcrR family transcriptional regulator n=1 Tax=Zoogloea sp. TaxID=49181 RepID=UPI00260AD6A8|nr:TetR/AcrR family transcriptional regulator [Zoogloea sp.]